MSVSTVDPNYWTASALEIWALGGHEWMDKQDKIFKKIMEEGEEDVA